VLEYEISQVIKVLLPYLSNTIAVLSGVIIANFFWKARIHRYAKTEVVETLEYQKNKIEYLEAEIKSKNAIIDSQKASLGLVKISALKIIEAVK